MRVKEITYSIIEQLTCFGHVFPEMKFSLTFHIFGLIDEIMHYPH